jgi:hypothetical protein
MIALLYPGHGLPGGGHDYQMAEKSSNKKGTSSGSGTSDAELAKPKTAKDYDFQDDPTRCPIGHSFALSTRHAFL